MKYVKEHLGVKPSPGSMYPLLDGMLKNGLVVCKKEGRQKIYSLSNKGRAQIKQLDKHLKELFQKMREGFNLLGEFTGEDTTAFDQAMESIRKGEFLFKEISPEILHFRHELFRLYASGKMKYYKKEIKTALTKATNDLKKIK
jgi:DNA-binding MarR family transcriptional regulator